MAKLDLRQSVYRGTLSQIGNQANPEGDNLLSAINNQITPLLRLSASLTPNLVVAVGASDITDSETNRRRAIPHVGSAYVQFTSGTVTFPAASGGNIVCSPGSSTVLTISSGNYAAVLIYLDGAGNLNAIAGTDTATESAAITNLPPAPDETLAAGFVVVRNIAGVIQNITQSSIRQFGIGTGGGSGSGNELLESLKNQFIDSYFQLLTPNIFRVDKGTKVDVSSTGAYSLIDRSFNFAASSVQTFVSTDMLDPQEFLANANSLEEVELSVYWRLANIDTSAVYEVSRNGGLAWQTLNMERVGSTDLYRGYHRFADEVANQTLYSPAVSGDLNASNELSQSFVVPAGEKKLIKGTTLTLTKTGTPAGNIFVSICADNAGSPGTVLSESSAITANSLTTGSNAVSTPDVYLAAGTYHIKVRTDAAYKASYVDGVTELNLSGSTVAGLDLDLRLRISSSNTAGVKKLDGYGIFYDKALSASVASGAINLEVFEFSGSANLNEFTLTKFVPHPDLLKVYDVNTGQVYDYGAFSFDGQKVVFEPGQFLQPGQTVKLRFIQIEGSAFDNSDANALLLASNFLGSTDPSIDRSQPGRGIFLRRPDGTLREVTIDNNDQIVIYSV
jgi:hypothetical protein